MIHFYIGIGLLIVLGYLMLKYLDGDFTVISEDVIKEGAIKNKQGERTGTYFIIQRTYKSGKIKLINRDL